MFDQVMTPLGVSRNKLARDIDVPVGRISDVVAGKRGVTPDTALRFAKYFGTTAELWLRLQADYDLYVARTTTWQDAETKVSVYEPAHGEIPDEAGPPKSVELPDVSVAEQATPGTMTVPPDIPADQPTSVDDEIGSEERERLPSEIDLDDGNIDIPEPAGPKA